MTNSDSKRETVDAETRLVSLVEQAPDGIFVADLDGRYTDVNAAGCRMLGYAREEIIGKTIADLIPDEDVPRLQRSKQELLQGRVLLDEWSLRRKDGTYLPVEVSAKILPDGRWQGFVRDISERKRTERQLRESEERFRLTIDEAPIGMALVAPDGRFVRVNRRLCETLGYTVDELTALTFSAITHRDDLEVGLELTGKLYRGEIPRFQLEKRYICKDGTVVEAMLSASALRDEDGNLLRYIAQIEDITQRKMLERELRFSEAKASGILSISADAIISIDEDQRITLFNDGAEKIFGYTRAEVMGAPLDMLIPERFREIHRRHVRVFAEGEKVSRRMGEHGTAIFGLHRNGHEFPADAAISKLEIDGKRILTVVLRDVTEQKRVETEQRFLAEAGPVFASTLDYQDILTRIAELVVRDLADFCIVDLIDDDGEVRRLEVASRDPAKDWVCDRFMRIPLDRTKPHLVGSALETKQPMLVERIWPADLVRLAQSEEHLAVLRAAELESVMALPLMAHDELLGAIVLLSSTPSRRYEPQDLRFADRVAQRAALAIENAKLYRIAQRAIQARDHILSVVAHDLRTPLNTLALQAQLLRPPTGRPERRSQKPADAIERATTRMNRLIQDILDVTRIEAHRLSIEQRRVSVMEVISQCVEAQRPRCDSSSLDLRFDVRPDLPDLWADSDRLVQALENLISNAIRFTGCGGRITVGAAPRDGEVLFWIADTGIGIAAAELPHVFDRFWRAHRDESAGAGLGLTIVKGIVEAHGGRVWVESQLGEGTTFYFTVPAAAPSKTHAHPLA